MRSVHPDVISRPAPTPLIMWEIIPMVEAPEKAVARTERKPIRWEYDLVRGCKGVEFKCVSLGQLALEQGGIALEVVAGTLHEVDSVRNTSFCAV